MNSLAGGLFLLGDSSRRYQPRTNEFNAEIPGRLSAMRRRNPLWAVIALAGLSLGSSVNAWAHHSFAQFDHHKTMTLHGVVQSIIWANPHVYLFVVVRGKDGKAQTYTVECASLVELTAAGWTRHEIKVGDEGDFRMYPLRSGKPGGLFDSAVLVNGKKINGNV